MRRIFCLLGILLMSVGTTTTRNVDKGCYRVVYDESREQPVKVTYTVACSKGKFSREGLDFVAEPGIHTSDNADYKNNDWDKGHMAPFGSFSCNEANGIKTFSYVNCALQHKSLNRGVWKDLEMYERELSVKERVDITIKVHFSAKSVRLKTGAVVPDGFTKTIKRKSRTEVFYFDNKEPLYRDIEKYRIK